MGSAEREPLLNRMPPALVVPPVLVQPGVEKLDSPVTIQDDPVFPVHSFASARYDARQRKLPQCISHRGYKAKYPENTITAFKAALKAGTHALETDTHVTKDGVVVLSHDGTLKRCYGKPDKIIDKTWDEIKDLRTIEEPHEPMARLQDLLEYLAQSGLEETWILLDVKLDCDADTIMRLLRSTIEAAPAPAGKPWKERILLGIWAAKYLPSAQKHLPGFPVAHIGFAVGYARHFFTVPNVSFNMLLPILMAPGGRRFIRDAKEVHHRQVIAWTVNEEDKMEWCIRRRLDGVICDDPAKFLGVCERFDESKTEAWFPISVFGVLDVVRLWVFVNVAFRFYRKRFVPVASRELIRKEGGLS